MLCKDRSWCGDIAVSAGLWNTIMLSCSKDSVIESDTESMTKSGRRGSQG